MNAARPHAALDLRAIEEAISRGVPIPAVLFEQRQESSGYSPEQLRAALRGALAALGVDVEAAISATTADTAPDPSAEASDAEHAP